MIHVRIVPSLVPLALLASLSFGATQDTPAPIVPREGIPTVVELGQIVLDQYFVRNVDPEELFRLASGLVGRTYVVREGGGVTSLRLLGRTIVLYDTKEQVQRARALLERLDAPRPDENKPRETIEYRPRFVSLAAAHAAVQELVDLSVVQERGLLVLHDDTEDVESAVAVLKRIDVPEKQVLLTCQMIEVGATPQPGAALPKELVDNLQKLLPQTQFAQTGMAMLKTSVGAQSAISVRIDSGERAFRLSLTPVAFDESSSSLAVENCTLLDLSQEGQHQELFRTDTVLHGGEYTVLAATGASPKLLVVRVTPQ